MLRSDECDFCGRGTNDGTRTQIKGSRKGVKRKKKMMITHLLLLPEGWSLLEREENISQLMKKQKSIQIFYFFISFFKSLRQFTFLSDTRQIMVKKVKTNSLRITELLRRERGNV